MNNTITLDFEQLVNAYDDDQLFEDWFCAELGISPAGCFEDTPDGRITTDDAYRILEHAYSGKKFTVSPNADYIKWRGKLSSDFTISIAE